MNRKEALSILKNGTNKAKLNLIAELDEKAFSKEKDSLLTSEEQEALKNSFSINSKSDIEFQENMNIILHAFQGLQTGFFYACKTLSDLRGYVILWESIQVAERMVNMALEGIDDTAKRSKVANKIKTRASSFLLSSNILYDNGFFGVSVEEVEDDEQNLMEAIHNVRNDVILALTSFKTSAAVIKDWMAKTNIKPKAYVSIIKEWEKEVLADQSIWQKYSFNKGKYEDQKTDPFSKFRVYPDPSKIEIDPELYNVIQRKWGITKNG